MANAVLASNEFEARSLTISNQLSVWALMMMFVKTKKISMSDQI
jgi:hypothetical protein